MRIRIADVRPSTPASEVGLVPGDEVASVGGIVPRDVLDYTRLTAEPGVTARLADGRQVPASALVGARIDDAAFDGVQTCDNHCEFCFIYQLPGGLRRTLYLKDDDYRLSALYGNFTTLTRFTELDLERVIDERISPLHVSIHATDPDVRSRMLRNRKGAMSLRWLRALLDAEIEVHGQIVLCPGTNDGEVLSDTLAELLAGWPELASVGVVPLGVSRFNAEPGLRAPTQQDAVDALEVIHSWQETCIDEIGRRLVFASDEFYLLADEPFPKVDAYEGFPQHENGIGMARALEADLAELARATQPPRAADPAPGAPAWGYRPVRLPDAPAHQEATPGERVAILSGEYGARVLGPLLERVECAVEVSVVPVRNEFFGGNTAVTGLLTGADIAAAASRLDIGTVAVVPDVVFNEGVTLDGQTIDQIEERCGRQLRVVSTDAGGLRKAVGL